MGVVKYDYWRRLLDGVGKGVFCAEVGPDTSYSRQVVQGNMLGGRRALDMLGRRTVWIGKRLELW